jgi:tRNA(fMet)-specific endonuclease VapC
MSLRFLLDTNVLSEATKAQPNVLVMAQLKRHAAEAATAAPSWNELWFGAHRLPVSEKRKKIESYLAGLASSGFPVLAYDAQAAEWHAAERARLTRLGRTPGFIDGQIAAVAAVHDLVLITANVADFRAFEGLRVEDWSTA